jgi:hypothetical protein
MTGLRRIAVSLLVLAGMWPGVVAAQVQKAGVVTTLEGNVTAARSTAAQPVALKFKDDVFVNDRVVTGDRSLARLLLGGKAVVTVRERSALTITEVPGRSTIDLDSGKVAVAVAKDKMRPGEQIEVKSPNAVAAVRGTVFVVEVIRASANAARAQSGVTVNHYVLTGAVALTVGGQSVNVNAGNYASVTGGVVSSGLMSAAMRADATQGFTPSGLPKVSGAEGDAKQAVMSSTVATFSTTAPAFVAPPPLPTPPTIQLPAVQDVLLPGGGQTTLNSLPPTPPPTTKPTGVLLFGDADISPPVDSRTALASTIRSVQPSVLITDLNSPTLPADLSAYGTIWYVGAFSGISPTDQTRLAQFLARGGGLYLTGERRCCQTLNSSVQLLLQTVVVNGRTIVVGSNRDFFPPAGEPLLPAAFNPGARGNVTTTPNTLTAWFPNAPGEILGISGANVLSTLGEGVVAGVWNESDLMGGAGRIVLMMDVDWLSNQASLAGCDALCRQQIIENYLLFLDDPAVPIVLNGPLFRSVNETLSTKSTFFDLPSLTLTNTSLDPLFWFSGSTLTTQGVFARMSDSVISTAGSFLRLESGAQIVQSGTEALVSMLGGALAVGTGGSGNLFDLVGRAGATQVDETGLIVGTDRPIQPGVEAPVFQAENGAVVNVRGSAYKVDTALLEATAPLLNLIGASSMTTGDSAVNLVNRAKVSIPNDAVSMVTLRSSVLNVATGHLVNVGGGSVLNIAGNLVMLADASTLNIFNGLLLNVSGNSSASIGKSLVSFSGTGNVVNVNNSIAPTAIINGIPVAGPVDSFRIGANAIGGTGAGTIKINGVQLTPTTPLSSLTGSLIAVQGSGSVSVGPTGGAGGSGGAVISASPVPPIAVVNR